MQDGSTQNHDGKKNPLADATAALYAAIAAIHYYTHIHGYTLEGTDRCRRSHAVGS